MPGGERRSIDERRRVAETASELRIPALALFPVTAPEAKSLDAVAAWDDDGLCQRAIRALKQRFPELDVITHLARDPYTSHAQAGIVDDTGHVIHDVTVQALAQHALAHAHASHRTVAPSDIKAGLLVATRAQRDNENSIT